MNKSNPFEKILVALTARFLDRPWQGVLLVAVFVAGCAALIPRLKFDNSVDAFFLENDDVLERYDAFRKTFESDEFVMVLVEHPGEWTADFIGKVRGMVKDLAKLEHVIEVTSITNVRYIEGKDDALVVGDFIKAEDETPEGLRKKKALAMTHPHYSDFYVSRDGKYVAVVAKTEVIKGEIEYKRKLAGEIRALISRPEYAALSPHAVGAALVDSDVRDITGRESGRFGGMVFLLVGAGFFMVFRRPLGVVLPLGIALLSMLAAFAALGAIGGKVNILTPIIPSFMLAVGVGAAVFLLSEVFEEMRRGLSARDALVHSIRTSGVASCMSVLTTAGGLLAFSSSRIRPVQEVGVGMGIGLLFAFALTSVIVPTYLGFKKTLPMTDKHRAALDARVDRLGAASEWVLHNPKMVLAFCAALFLVAIAGAMRLKADYYYQGLFKESSQIRQDYDFVDSSMGGSSSIEVTIDGKKENGVKDPALLAKVEAFQNEVEKKYASLGAKSYSMVDVLKEIGQAVNGGDPAYYQVPATPAAVEQSLFLFEESGSKELKTMVTRNYETMRVTIRVKSLPDSAYHPLFRDLEHFANEMSALPGSPVVQPTGLLHMWNKIQGYLMASQISALLVCVPVVTIVMMLMLRSIGLGLAMTLCNMVPIVVTLGLMGWAGIELDPYTILISSIALGILDDDTIHGVRRVIWEIEHGKSLEQAIHESHTTAGQGAVYTAATMTVAFSVYAFSEMASLTKFGLLAAFTVFNGSVLEFLLTPTVLLAVGPWLLRDRIAQGARAVTSG